MRAVRLSALCLAMFLSQSALAADGSSGCGPAWVILNKNTIVSSALRATTNWILFPAVTLGMTFGSSNCAKHSIVKKEKASEYFATVSNEILRQDAARGNGEFVQAFAETFGCDSESTAAFGLSMQQHYADIYSDNPNPQDIVRRVYGIISVDPVLQQRCPVAPSFS